MSTFDRRLVDTGRLTMNVWTSGPEDGDPVLLVHGNLSTGGFWKYVAEQLPDDVRVIAPDLRGFGRTDALPIDATVGLGDLGEDVHALLETLGVADQRRVNAAGWSMGGGVLQQLLIAHPADLAAITLVAPLSPYGFGGTKGAEGIPWADDFAGTGGGGANPELVRRLAAKDASLDNPATSPRAVITTFYGPGDNGAVDVDFLVDELLLTQTGDDFYPGNSVTSENWPGVAPGDRGVLNTMSPRWFNSTAIVDVEPKPPITWLRGDRDQVASDRSMFDLATLGSLGVVPGWPGAEVMPSQPMEAQTRQVLEHYAAGGGQTREVVLEGEDHGMPLAAPDRVAEEIMAILVR
ncbi:alpha/beta fold hydrolase [Enemella dayhoffiae]|nr:alpha/beta hydrolase [Enemella dayhoffiae]